MKSSSFAAVTDLDWAATWACSVLQQCTVSFFRLFVKEGSDEFSPIHHAWLLSFQRHGGEEGCRVSIMTRR